MKNISFLGLGHMGNPMASNLLKAGYRVKVYDVSPEAIQSLVNAGAYAAMSLEDLVKDAEIIITMLQTGAQVKEVCLGPDGFFQYVNPNVLFIDSSSIDVTTTQQLHDFAKHYKIEMLDAPVSGGVAGASSGNLTFMVGGDQTVFNKAKPIFEKMGKKIVYVGAAGHGQAAKICNNLILGISMIAVCEGFNLAEKLGLDPKKFFEISANASSQCWSMTSYCPVPGLVETAPSNHNYQAGFMAKMMLKDLRLGQHAAESVNAAIPLGSEAAELYSLFVNQGHAEMDFSGIITMLRSQDL